jgi:hypothetical protein
MYSLYVSPFLILAVAIALFSQRAKPAQTGKGDTYRKYMSPSPLPISPARGIR